MYYLGIRHDCVIGEYSLIKILDYALCDLGGNVIIYGNIRLNRSVFVILNVIE